LNLRGLVSLGQGNKKPPICALQFFTEIISVKSGEVCDALVLRCMENGKRRKPLMHEMDEPSVEPWSVQEPLQPGDTTVAINEDTALVDGFAAAIEDTLWPQMAPTAEPKPTPITDSVPPKGEVGQLIDDIKGEWLHGRERRLALGLKLIRLKELLPHGQFIPTVEDECGIPYTTARDYMKEAHAAGLAQKYESRTFEVKEPELTENPDYQKHADDPQAARVEAAKKQAKEKRNGLGESLNARVIFPCPSTAMRDRIKQGTRQLGGVASAVIYHLALFPEFHEQGEFVLLPELPPPVTEIFFSIRNEVKQ
jgi:hypothetical protein